MGIKTEAQKLPGKHEQKATTKNRPPKTQAKNH